MNSEHFHALPKGYRFGDFEIVRVLGQGGFGITYLGYDHNLLKPVAIKEYLPSDLAVRDSTNSVVPKAASMAEDFQSGLDSFLGEARTLARFDHRNIIRVFHFFRANGTAYIVMEYAEGEDLSDVLKRRGKLSEDELKPILMPILEGLALVHKAGILHRDIKPHNIMIRDDGSPVLIDFGAARQVIGAMSRSITAIVTPGYAPLEQYSPRGNQGPWTDIYALGAVAYKCLTGKAPPDAPMRMKKDPFEPLGKVKSVAVSEGLAKAVNRALAVDEEDRPQSLDAWKSMLEGKAKTPAEAPPEPTVEEVAEPPVKPAVEEVGPASERPSRTGLYVGLAAALLLVVGGIASYVSWNTPAAPGPGSGLATDSAPAAETTDTASLIEEAQGLLNRLGYEVGPPNGRMTPRTEAAIRKFEKDQGLIEVGAIDALLIQELKAELARRDEAAWQAAKAAGSIPALEDYRKAWPRGIHVVEIANEARKISEARAEAARLKAARDDERAWTEAKQKDTIKGYGDYRKAYPTGKYVAKANDEISRLRAEAAEAAKRKVEAEKRKAEREDDAAWTKAKAADDAESYRGYLKAWPAGRHAAEARRAMEPAKITAIAAGGLHVCALKAGRVLCWGYNDDGQTDVPPQARSGVTAIAAGGFHACALKGGGMLCWGENDEGQSDVPPAAGSGVSAIAAGSFHSCALKAGGVLCWGYNAQGQSDVPPAAGSGVAAISAGWSHSCALKSGGMLCWGSNLDGQTTVPPAARSGVTAIATGGYYSCALRNDGGMLCWGENDKGQTAVPAGARSGVSAITAGRSHSCALKDGGVLCWGQNDEGESDVPARAKSGVSAIAAGGTHSCALKDGGMLCWGFSGGEVPAQIRAPD